LVLQTRDAVGSIPVTNESFLISGDSNQVPKWFRSVGDDTGWVDVASGKQRKALNMVTQSQYTRTLHEGH